MTKNLMLNLSQRAKNTFVKTKEGVEKDNRNAYVKWKNLLKESCSHLSIRI